MARAHPAVLGIDSLGEKDTVRSARALAIANVVLLAFLANALPLNFLFAETPLYGWKQFGAAALFFELVLVWVGFGGIEGWILRRQARWIRASLFAAGALAALTLFAGLSPLRIAHAAIAYIGFCCFLFTPGLAGIGRWERGFVASIALLGVFCGIGLAVDYFFNVFDILARVTGGAVRYQEWAERYEGMFRRATFLFESPSNIFPLLSLSVICLVILGDGARSRPGRILCHLAVLPVIFGIFVTQTRAQWVLAAVLVFGIVLVRGRRSLREVARRAAVTGVLAAAVLFLIWATVLRGTQSEEVLDRMSVGMSLATEENEFRVQAWHEGLGMFLEPSAEWLTGYGLGTTMAQIDDGRPVEFHFESSLLQSFYEGGAGGLALRLWMPVAILLMLRRTGAARGPRGRLLKLWVGCYVVAIGIAPSAGAYHAQGALAIVLGMACMPMEWWGRVDAPERDRAAGGAFG